MIIITTLTKDYFNDVWLSNNNGKSWIEAILAASWSGRGYHSSVVIGSTIFVMGGWDGNGGKKTISCSIFIVVVVVIIIFSYLFLRLSNSFLFIHVSFFLSFLIFI